MEKEKKAEEQESRSTGDGVAPKVDNEGPAIYLEANEESAPSSTLYSSLQRTDGQGMNPRSILMGIYGSRGEKFRHTVHDGALRLPSSAIGILDDLQQECTRQTKVGPKKSFRLPSIDGVLRPSMDSSLGSIIVTELTAHKTMPTVPVDVETPEGVPPPPLAETSKWETHTINRLLKLTPNTDTAERIRGGGGGDDFTPSPFLTATGNIPPDQAVTTALQTNSQNSSSGLRNEITSQVAHPASDPYAPSGVESGISPEGPQQSAQATLSADVQAMYPQTQPQMALQSSSTLQPDLLVSSPSPKAMPPWDDTDTPAPTQAPVPSPTALALPAAAPSQTFEETAPQLVESAAPPQIVSSSSTAPKAATSAAVVALPSRPRPQWEQLIPGPNDEMPTEPKTAKPSWYSAEKISEFERSVLPEWFDGSASHRTPDSYRQARERIIHMSDLVGNRFVTGTLVRRTIPGDAGSLLRLHGFLVTWGFINEDAINDSAPTGSGIRGETGAPGSTGKSAVIWNEKSRDELMEAVVDESNKRRRLDDTISFVPIDWNVVAKRVGNGASASDCERAFLSLPLEGDSKMERSITPDGAGNEKEESTEKVKMDLRENMLKDIIDGSRPEVVKAATDAALKATDHLVDAQKAAVLALVAAEAVVRARKEEDAISRLLVELHEQRLQKLENRLALLDDVEGVLEAERVALELERRDLYTARCRHWFGGGT